MVLACLYSVMFVLLGIVIGLWQRAESQIDDSTLR